MRGVNESEKSMETCDITLACASATRRPATTGLFFLPTTLVKDVF